MNKVEVYYFSGTGNSLAVARDISESVNGQLIAIPTMVDGPLIKTAAEAIGIVFPVYNHGVPYIIKRFIDKLDNIKGKYIFAVCTYGGCMCLALEYIDKMLKLRGGRLAAGFGVKMPYNYVSPTLTIKNFFRSFSLSEVSSDVQEALFVDCSNRLEEIKQCINARKESGYETSASTIEHIIDFLNLRELLQKRAWLKVAGFEGHTALSFIESIQLMDYGFCFDEKCVGCDICSKICPVKNIRLDNGRPVWQHHCEQCFACLHWCPKEAIQYGICTQGKKRYHHPGIKLADMLNIGNHISK